MNSISCIAQISLHQPCKQLSFDYNTITLSLNSTQKEEVKFDYVYKYNAHDQKQTKKCIKSLHKQALLPKIIQNVSQLFVIPMFEPN